MGADVFPPLLLPTSFFICLVVAILMGVRWHLPVVWICIFLIISGVEQLFQNRF